MRDNKTSTTEDKKKHGSKKGQPKTSKNKATNSVTEPLKQKKSAENKSNAGARYGSVTLAL